MNTTDAPGAPGNADDFSAEQKRYLEGLANGLAIARMGKAGAAGGGAGESAPSGPEHIHHAAQDRQVAMGRTLVAEEKAKRERHPLDRWDELRARAQAGQFPRGTDVFLTKFHGLFYVAPAQDSYMIRLRIPGGILNAHQLRGVAGIAERHGGPYCHITTRANLQVREIGASSAERILIELAALGLTSRGSGADNIRNITGNPTAGIDPGELYDVRALCEEMHHYILNHREMIGLPRKFNIAFCGGGAISALEDTNDIGFAAVAVGEGQAVPPGVYFRMQLGGITGHGDFARDCGVLLAPHECVPVAAAVVQVFSEHGNRSDRTKARMKYVIDAMGLEAYLAHTEQALGRSLTRLPLSACLPRPPERRDAHLGVHPQKQPGLHYVGVVVPVGRLSSAQMRGLAALAERHGSGTLRLTVWQNLLISDVPEAELPALKAGIEALGLDWKPLSLRAGLVACTGNTGCKFAAADTKRHALAIAAHVESRLTMDTPVNIHLTGCHHSCAQHYIGDIGLIACKVGEEGAEGYHLLVGGAWGESRAIARELYREVPATALPELIERMLAAYLDSRSGPQQDFRSFVAAHDAEALKTLFARGAAVPA